MKRFYYITNLWRLLPVYCFITVNGNKSKIKEEIKYWGRCLNSKDRGFFLFAYLMCEKKEYRNLLCYRLKDNKIQYIIVKALFPNDYTLQICSGKIGWNLFIQHGFATQISAREIGEYCWINQQVTIGYSFDSAPQ